MRRIPLILFVAACLLTLVGSTSAMVPIPAASVAPAGGEKTAPAPAVDPPAFVFVSTFNGTSIPQPEEGPRTHGGEILKIDTFSATVTPIYQPADPSFRPEDIAVGPDGKVYAADSVGDRIIRMNDDGSQVEIVYDAGTSGLTLIGPEGPVFLGDDLYVNTRGTPPGFNHTGVWRFAGMATVPFGGMPPAPVNILPEAVTGSNFGEGLEFAVNGDLLILDRQNQRLLRSIPPFTSLVPFISLSKLPFGVAVNSVGEIFISVHDPNPEEGPLTGDILKFAPDGTSGATLVSFLDTAPNFMEFDADDTLWVATSNTPTGTPGQLMRVDTSGVAFLVADELSGSVGLAVPPTEAKETRTFSQDNQTQTFDFGNHTLRISDNITGSCDVTVTAVEVSQADLQPRFNNFFPNARCVRYPSKGGYCVVYVVEPSPLPPCFAGNIDMLLKYFTLDETSEPAFLHDDPPSPPDDFNENLLISYLPNLVPGDDPGMRGSTDDFSGFVAVNLLFTDEGNFQGFLPPLVEGARYNSGRNIPVRFRVVDDQGRPIQDASANIGVLRIAPDFAVVDVQSPGNLGNGTAFRRLGNGNYLFDLKTTGYAPGTYAITVSADVFPPQTIKIEIR